MYFTIANGNQKIIEKGGIINMSHDEFQLEIEKIRNEIKERDKTSVSNSVILWVGFMVFSGVANIVSILLRDKHSFLLILLNFLILNIGVIGLTSRYYYPRISYPPKTFYKAYFLLWLICIFILILNFYY